MYEPTYNEPDVTAVTVKVVVAIEPVTTPGPRYVLPPGFPSVDAVFTPVPPAPTT
jgi:hypothetical protein